VEEVTEQKTTGTHGNTDQQTKVLLVDDNDAVRQVLRMLLENVGIIVAEAENGAQAVARVEADEFDLVFMDIQMPVMDGLSATRAIRNLTKNSSGTVPIIAMTANTAAELRDISMAAGLNGHLTKPVEFETLYTELQHWLPLNKLIPHEGTSKYESTTNADLATALPGVDVNNGIQRVLGKREIYLELLRKFMQLFSPMPGKLRHELETGQRNGVIYQVHTLKGVAGNLGATQLYKMAGRLEEQLARERNPEALTPMLNELQRILNALRNMPQLYPPPTGTNKISGSDNELLHHLKKLLTGLKILQVQTVKLTLIQLQEKSWPEKYREKLAQLEEHIKCYQFGPAADLVQVLLEES